MTIASPWRGCHAIHRRDVAKPTIAAVMAEVAAKYGIPVGYLRKRDGTRSGGMHKIRQEAMYECRQQTGRAYSLIAHAFGRSNHATIIHGCRRHAACLAEGTTMTDLLSPVFASEFDAWWAVYPRRTAKGAARKAFERARQRVGFDALMAATRAFAESAIPCDMMHLPHGTTWLNQNRWEDDINDVRAVYARPITPNEQRLADHGASLQRMLAGAMAAVDGEGLSQGHRATDRGEPHADL